MHPPDVGQTFFIPKKAHEVSYLSDAGSAGNAGLLPRCWVCPLLIGVVNTPSMSCQVGEVRRSPEQALTRPAPPFQRVFLLPCRPGFLGLTVLSERFETLTVLFLEDFLSFYSRTWKY